MYIFIFILLPCYKIVDFLSFIQASLNGFSDLWLGTNFPDSSAIVGAIGKGSSAYNGRETSKVSLLD